MEILILREDKRLASYLYYPSTSFRFLDKVISLKQVPFNLSLIYSEKLPTICIFLLEFTLKRAKRKGPWSYKDWNFVSAVLFSSFLFKFFFPFSTWAFASKHWLVTARIFKENPHTYSPSSAFKLSTFQAYLRKP